MEITRIEPFLDYWERVRERTLRVARIIPPEQLEWAPAPGRFTLGDTLRHLAAIERYMWAEVVAGRPSHYHGCGRELADGYDGVFRFIETLHRESVQVFSHLTPEALRAKMKMPEGGAMTVWKGLRAMVEHEIHHRGQIYVGLGLLGVRTPPIFGMTSEELRARSSTA